MMEIWQVEKEQQRNFWRLVKEGLAQRRLDQKQGLIPGF